MFVDVDARSSTTPFGGTEVNETFATLPVFSVYPVNLVNHV